MKAPDPTGVPMTPIKKPAVPLGMAGFSYLAPETRFELVTRRLTADCSTIEPLRNGIWIHLDLGPRFPNLRKNRAPVKGKGLWPLSPFDKLRVTQIWVQRHAGQVSISMRPSMDFLSVTGSAYSISPPTGRPRAIRVTFTPPPFSMRAI